MENQVFLLITLLTIIAVWDFRFLKIPNGFLIVGVSLGLISSYIAHGLSPTIDRLGFLLLFLFIFFIVWSILESLNYSVIGAGDLKLIVMLFSFMAWTDALFVFFFSIFVGSLIFMVILPPREIKQMFDEWVLFLFYHFPISRVKDPMRIPFAVPVLISVILHYVNLLPFH